MAKPIEVTAETFDVEVLHGDQPVVVDFWSHTCPACLQLNPQYEAAAEQLEGRVKFAKIAAQDGLQPFRAHSVMATPTMVLFIGGTEKARETGTKSADGIKQWLESQI